MNERRYWFPKPYADQVARLRVPAGFVLAASFLYLAAPDTGWLATGASVAFGGLLLRAWAAGFLKPDRAAVLCGDFNVVPTPLDSYDEEALAGEIFHTAAERARYAALLAVGLHDLYREREPATKAFTWWDYRGGAFHRKQGLRIDFLLGTPAVVARLRSVEIDREFRKKRGELTPSDHAPVLAVLDEG